MAMIIDSFIVSRADLPTQYFYFEFLYLKYGFNYVSTFNSLFLYPNFSKPWENLTSEERKLFLEHYQRYNSHKKITEEEMINEFDNNVIRIFMGDTNKFFGELDTIVSLESIGVTEAFDFRNKLIDYRKTITKPRTIKDFK